MANSNSRRHARKVTLDAAVSNAIAKAVDARKVAAFTVGAAGVLAGAAFAFGATPAMAAEAGVTPDAKPDVAQTPVTAGEKAGENAGAAGENAGEKASADENGKDAETGKSDKKNQTDVNKEAGEQAGNTNKQAENKSENTVTTDDSKDKSTVVRSATYAAVGGTDRASNNDEANQDPNKIKPDTSDTTNTKINIDENNAETMPNAYGWGSSDNTYSVNGETHTVTFNFAAPKNGGKITNIAIFPAQNNGLTNDKSKRGAEYYSGDPKMHQSFSGNYTFTPNDQDGSATLTMSDLFRDGNIGAAEKYAANRSIFVYVTAKDGTTTIYKTNAFRAATLVPPKTAGSVVLKYNQELTPEKVRAAITAAANSETARVDKKSVNDQLAAASASNGVFTRENGKAVRVTDTTDGKINVKSKDAYDAKQFKAINTETSDKDAKNKTYVAGAKTLNTYMVTDLGFKSEAIPLTVARYDTRIDKPIVEDPTKVSDEVKADIKRKLARLNNVSLDQVTINDQGEFTINFDGVDAADAPKIKLSDLVLKQLEEKDVTVPSDAENSTVKAVIVANPLGYSTAELKQIKKAIYEANKYNTELGLSATDYENQISLSYLDGNLTAAGKGNQGISNGQAENTITVKIKTDKAVAKFTSDVKAHKLTRLADIRKDYNVSWTKDKIDGRDTDEGFSWSEDKKTIIYRYDSTKAEEFDTNKILDLLRATAKDKNSGLRDLTGNEKLDHEGVDGKDTKSHVGYVIKDDQPTTELSLGNMSGAYWQYSQKVDNSGVDLGDNLSEAGSYSWDNEAKPVFVAAKKGKVYKARLFVLPYGLTMYRNVYMENGNQPWNTPKAINVIFVPQMNHKTSDLKTSVEGHKTVAIEGKDVPTQSAYYNASDKVKKDYEDALKVAKQTLEKVGTTPDDQLTEQLKAEVDNATIKLNKAREALDGAKTNKDGLDKSITEDGAPAQGQNPASGTQATDRYKNVTEPDFKTPDGKADEARNNAAKEAKKAYDEALQAAKDAKANDNATQKDVDAAKAKLDAARAKLNDFTTSKDKLNAAIAEHGKVNTGIDEHGTQDKTKADPRYQNADANQQKAYDDAVKKANELSKDPNASQKDVNAAIDALQKAKAALDAKATDKSKLIATEKLSFDNPDPTNAAGKQSTFYKNAKAKSVSTDAGVTEEQKAAAKKAYEAYDTALDNARKVIANKDATQAQVDEAKKKLEAAEKVLHDTYATDPNELTKVLADNFSGYLMPAYFNAFDKAQAGDKDAADAFKNYNDAYQKAKELKKNFEATDPSKQPTATDIADAKKALEDARKVIDKYATNTSRLSAAVFNDLAIQNSPAYANVKELADKQNPSEEEKAQVEAAKKAKEAYEAAVAKLNQALNKQMPRDKANGKDIPDTNTPDKDGKLDDKDYLNNIQAHAQGEPLDRDVDTILKEMNAAAAELNKFATKTDELLKSVNEHDNTQQTPAFKNANHPDFRQADGTTADKTKNDNATAAANAYGAALNAAKELLKNPAATQKQVNDAKTALDNARKELDKYNTDTAKLVESVKKHGDTEGTAPTEGTQTSDAYRNASDPHFMKDQDGKLVPDDTKNNAAAAAKKAYDDALTKAQELLKKHDDNATPQDAKPTQTEINAALKKLDDARTEIEKYNTDTSKLEEETRKSTPENVAVTENDFENTPEFQNADAKKKDGADGKKVDNDDVKAYKDALAKARKLAQDNTSNTLSDHPTQKQIDDALEALKKAKQAIIDGYKTDVDKLKQAKEYADGAFKNTPEYKNATAVKNDNNNAKHEQAGKDLDGNDQNPGLSKLVEKITAKLQNASKMTQKEVDALVKQLVSAQRKITDNYKTNVDKLNNEVGDKNQEGKPVTPKFEESIPYKNALEKAKTEDATTTDPNSATAKLKDYNDKLKAAQDLIAQVNSTDPNADPDKKPTQAQVDAALKALQDAKKAIDDSFGTKIDDLKTEAAKSTADGGTVADPDFEATTEFKNADAKKGDDGKSDNADVAAYKEALKKARTLLNKFDENGKPKPGEKDIPSQKEVDEALKNLKEIKDKITKNYVTSPHDLQEEFDKSKDGNDDDRDDVFENTPAFKNATAKGDDAAKQALKDYNDKLNAAKTLLDKFDRTTGKPRTDLPAGEKAPTQKQLDDALKALQDAKSKIEKDYSTSKHELSIEHSEYSSFENSPEFINAIAYMKDDISGHSAISAIGDYKKALEDAKKVLDDPNATQSQVDEALRKLKEAKDAITRKYGTDKDKLKDEHDADSDFADSPEFQNANGTPEAEAYKKALEDAKKVLNDPNATQAQVDAALRKLREAKDALANKYKTDKDALQSEADDDPNFRNNTEYLIAGTPEADAYNKALEEAKKVLNDPNATQAQVDAALKKLREAKQRIIDKLKDFGIDINFDNGSGFGNGNGNGFNGYVNNANANANANAVDKSALQAEVNNALDVRGNSDAAQAYKNALADAKRVLADANASQADVDAALQRLRNAKAGLLNESNVADHNLAKTGASTGLFAGLAAIFAGFGAAGVASRRRKHSNE